MSRDAERTTLLRLRHRDTDEVVDVLCDAFAGYPLMRHVLDGPAEAGDAGLRHLIRFFVQARILRDDPLIGALRERRVGAVALLSHPHGQDVSTEMSSARKALWEALGPGAEGRYEAYSATTRPFFPEPDRLHLNMIGTRGAFRGTGLGRRLLEEVHKMSSSLAGSRGVTLTTEVATNVSLYEHFGYEVVAHARVSDDLETWGMFRSNRG